ncbi:hypothetical protein SMALA_7204 [Streptomyces malaysiensis subsp. malaysiensis]|nr:hypothetical protein SMALA_7204 [Streptomyces malaysiensis]
MHPTSNSAAALVKPVTSGRAGLGLRLRRW